MESSDRNPAVNDVPAVYAAMYGKVEATTITETGSFIDNRVGQFDGIVETTGYYILSYSDLNQNQLVFVDKATNEVVSTLPMIGTPRGAQQVGDYIFVVIGGAGAAGQVQIFRVNGSGATLVGGYQPLPTRPLVGVGATYFSNDSGEGWFLGCLDENGTLYTAVQYGGDLDNPNFGPSNQFGSDAPYSWPTTGVSFLQQANQNPPWLQYSSTYLVRFIVAKTAKGEWINTTQLSVFSKDFTKLVALEGRQFFPVSPPGEDEVSFSNGPSLTIVSPSQLNILASQPRWTCDGGSCNLTINRFG